MAWPELKWEKEPQGPLKGVRVLDMSTVVLGPFATLQMADLGAEVIKVEHGGDMMRRAGQSPSDIGPIYAALNRNKKSIDLNAADPAQKAMLVELLKGADVFFHNVRMAGMERLGLDYDTVKAINPDIIYVHCAGYGSDGPYSQLQAFDDLIQAASGFAALSEVRDGNRPQYAPSLIADKVCGLFAANATMAALLARSNGAGGQFVQVPMFECFTWFHMVENLWGETFLPGNGKLAYTRSVNARRRPYPTADGFIAIVPYNDKQWSRFFELAGTPAVFDDPRFATYEERTKNTGELYALIEEATASKTTDEWLAMLAENNIPAMRYNRNIDVLSDPHLSAVGFFEERPVAGSAHYRSMRHPVHYSETPASYFAEPPSLDADGDEIREALGPVSHFVKP
ncbi:CaiB/BaiF CoA transferase family protein [Sphingorhabdus sp.]|jgi:crotonobetainyl-CoA:carnitine CoA-transferase CaiB-like acyl-CoA transferase|uniref:CaiB/BaiF CoA transferase family protein n=1 Tax=Sphingorhabdus sp. TaxID=1902408 RepID=UPI003BAFF306|nr:CoA transferase [Sphingomonadales bacterium]MBK9432440.1 CoA transferase [Sphingomonadales bacterium]MBL0022023.1 CoA transferase [Sphingomonadales bacterium]